MVHWDDQNCFLDASLGVMSMVLEKGMIQELRFFEVLVLVPNMVI